MTHLPPILNAPQVGMLIRTFNGPGTLVCEDLRTGSDTLIIYSPETGVAGHWILMPTDRVKWPNEPDTAWRNVFKVKEEPVREWAPVLMDPESGASFLGDWIPVGIKSPAICGLLVVGRADRERQPDGTWRAVTSEAALPINPEFSGEVDRMVTAKLMDKPRPVVSYQSRYAGLWEQHPDAEWMTTDEDGEVRWWDNEPIVKGITPWWNYVKGSYGTVSDYGSPCPDWRDSLERRPEGV